MKKIYLLFLLFVFAAQIRIFAQVDVTATAGTLTGTYTTLKAAFDAINAGTHKGDIIIDISASTNEGATPATLNSGDADPAGYSSVLIEPVADAVTISGNPAAGFGVIQLNGADNVVIIGDNPNTAGFNRDLTIANTSAPAVVAGSVIRIATRASAVTTADNNFILNCRLVGNVTAGNAGGITAATSSANLSYGIYCGGNAGTSSVTAPTAISGTVTPEQAATGTTINNLVVDNNEIIQCGRAIVFNGAVTSVGGSVTISNNLIGATGAPGPYPYTALSTTVYSKGILISGTDALSVTGNTIQNIHSYLSSVLSGIELSGAIGATLVDISGNTISAVGNNGTANEANGILVGASSNKFTVSGNTIAGVHNNSTTPVSGVQVATAGGQAVVEKNNISGIFNHNTGGYGAFGVYFQNAASGSLVQNNFIYDLMNIGNSSFGPIFNASGIYLAAGSGHKIYHNSVHLSGASTASSTNAIACLSVASAAVTGLDIRNNVFSNVVSGGSASDAHVCLFFPFTMSAGLNYTINNNAYFTGLIAGKSGLAFAGTAAYNAANVYDVTNFNPLSTTTPAGNFRIVSSSLGNSSNDFASFGSNAAAPFTSATNLHIPAATVTRIESGGTPVGITDDIDNAGRSATAPDMGADEFAGTPQDLTPPLITYTPLTGTCTLGARTLTVSVKDASGVPTSGLGLPRLYWFINGTPQAPVTATFVAGTTYTFSFGAGAVVPDVVTYYVVAQDNAGNVIAQPSAGIAPPFLTNPPSVTTGPSAPDSYNVQNNLATGTYTVGVAGIYPTLTAAVNAYNNSCLSGPIVFDLIDLNYPSETFPITIANPVASALNTLTIKPAAGVNATITGANPVAIFKLNGADYVTIDGSNNGTGSQNLTISNTDATLSSAVIWVASASNSNGATNNTIKNCTITGNGTNTTFGGIISSSGTTIGGVAEAANANNTYQNNTVHTSYYGIIVVGPSGGESNNHITSNKIGSVNVVQKLGIRGMFISNQTNVAVTNNQIFGVLSDKGSNTDVTAGITVRGSMSNGIINSNTIFDCKNTSTAGWTVHGITLQSSSPNSGLSVYNNMIYDIAGYGWESNVTDNGHGIGILSGGGYKIYFNSINLNTNQTIAANTAAIFIDNRVSAGGTPVNLTIVNNIFSNQQTTGARYAIYSAAPAGSFASINYNDYYSTGVVGYLGSARSTLANWQAASGQDGNSVAVDPLFITPTNLHLKGAPLPSSTLNGQATPIAGITSDIDGDFRTPVTDIGADEFTPAVCVANTGGTAVASSTAICVSGAVSLTATGYATGNLIAYQWEYSSDNFAADINPLPGETNPGTANPPAIIATTYYRLKVICNAGLPGYSNVITVTVSTPAILSSTPASRCGVGTVNLAATGTGGSSIKWYDNATGGTPLFTGSPFTTPVLSATTTFYAEASTGGVSGSVGPVSPSAQGGAIGTQLTSWDVSFDVLQATTLVSIDIYPVAAGQNSTLVVYSSAGVALGSYPYTTSVSGGSTPQTIPIGLFLPIGTDYYVDAASLPASGLTRNTSGATYPYTSSAINITGNGFLQTYYMCYYNWQFSSSCGSSPRTAVVATVSTPPVALTSSASLPSICVGDLTSLTAVGAGYSGHVWSPGSIAGNPVSVSPATTTTYTVTATSGACTDTSQVTIVVNPTPGVLTIAPAAPLVCAGSTQMLTVTGGYGTFFTEKFESFPISKFAVSGTEITENQSTTYFQEGASSVLLTYQNNIVDAIPSSYELSNNLNLTLYTNPVLTFQHICGIEGNGSSDWDFGYVEYSTDGGTNWTPFPVTSYTGSGTLRNGVVCFEETSYPDWSAQFFDGTSTPGVPPAASMWKLETIDLSAWQASTTFKFRFRVKSDGSVLHYGWLIDNVQIGGQASITWAPILELFTDAGAVTSYVGGTNHPVVYVKPTATRAYTATAQFGGCSVTANVTPTVDAKPIAISIAANPGTTICGGDTVSFTSIVNTQGALLTTYTWQVNGVTPTGSGVGVSSAGTTVTVASTAGLHVGMIVTKTAGVGNFAPNTRIASIISPTQFTVDLAPISALSGATIAATATGPNITSFSYSSLANGDVVTCILSVGGVSCVVPVTGTLTSNPLSFTVNATTPASVSVIVSPGTTVCAGETVTFTATPVNPGPGPTYEWYVNGISQGAPSVSPVFTTTTLTNGQSVTCRMISNAANCPFPKTPVSAPIVMTVNPSFPVSVTISANPGVNVCNGTNVTFTAVPVNGGVTPAYKWYINGVEQIGETASTFVNSTFVNGDIITCQVTSSIASCATNNPALSNALTMNITVQNAFVSIAPLTPICEGTSRTYTATPTNPGATPSYQWYLDGSPVGANSPSYTYTPAVTGSHLVKVEMTSSLSCASPAVADTTITQVVDPNPTVGIASTGTVVCSGAPVLFTATAVANVGVVSYVWSEQLPLVTVGTNSPTYLSSTVGKSYFVTVTNGAGCTAVSNIIGPLTSSASTAMSGIYTIGAALTTATAPNAGTTINVASTAGVIIGQAVGITSGPATGVFAPGTTVVSITNATQFVVSAVPTTALTAGAVITGATCTNYISFGPAITDLNTRSISAACTFNIPAGYIEQLGAKLPALGAAGLNGAVSAVNTITFQKNGAGVNPQIISYVGAFLPSSATPDGIFTISGTDYVTIDGIDLYERSTNLTSTTTMEYGYGLFKLSVTDGIRNTTIQNCVVSLNRINNAGGSGAMVEGAVGILLINSVPTAATTALIPTAASGTNSNNKFYNDSVQNCNYGIVINGYGATVGVGPAPNAGTFLGDLNNDIGGLSAATGNRIVNFGGAGVGQPAGGIRAINQWGLNISYNKVNSNNGGGANHVGALTGISAESGTSGNVTISYDSVSVKGAGAGQTVIGINNSIGTTTAGNTVNINNNIVANCTYSTATTGIFTGINNTGNAATININDNNVSNNTALGGTGTMIMIETGGINTLPNFSTVFSNNNIISGNTRTGASGALSWRLLKTTSPTNWTANGNTIENNSWTTAGSTGSIDAIVSVSAAANVTITNNIIRNLSIPTAGTINGIRENGVAGTKIIQGNEVYNFATTAGGAGGATFNGIFCTQGTVTITGNRVYALNSGGATPVGGIVAGIQTTGTTSTFSISKNRVYDLSSTSTAPLVYGFLFAGGLSLTANNNFINDLRTPAANVADAIRGIAVNTALAGSTYNIYYNTVVLNATSTGAVFGTSGIYHTTNVAPTVGALNLRNNIIYNLSVKNGAAVTAAYRRSSATLANYAATSNNNLFYAGTPSASNLIFFDGTNSEQTITTYKTRVAARDAASVSDKVFFVSPTDLRIIPDSNCMVSGLAAPIATFNDDFEGDARDASTPDIGADEFGSTAAAVNLTITNPAGTCTGSGIDLTAPAVTAGSSGGSIFYYYTDAAGTTALASPNNVITSGTYYIKYATGTCYSTIQPVTVTINPNGQWLGLSTDWTSAANWCGGVPNAATNVVIPATAPNFPVIVSGVTGLANNITINAGGSITTTGTGILEIKGSFTNNGNLLNWGEVKLSGSAAQTFPGATGTIGAMNDLTIANTSGANPAVTINRDLLIRGAITPTQGIVNLNSIYITLRSVVDSTARVGVVGAAASFTYTGTGNFVVERYYPGRRTWRLLTAPVYSSTRTIFGSWQVGGNNSLSGSGTYVTGITPNQPVNGLDASPLNNYSLKRFNYLTSGFDGIPNTRTARVSCFPAGNSSNYLTDTTGYFVFIRGDRTAANVNAFNSSGLILPTTLRDTGAVKTGNFTFNCYPGSGANIYSLVGNPYASPVDFAALTRNNLVNKFWAWDPNLNSVGGYVTLDFASGYVPVKVPLSSTGTVAQTQIIQSSQAILVEATGPGPFITFTEAAKSSTNNLNIFRPAAGINVPTLASNIFTVNPGEEPKLADGVVTQFASEFTNAVDNLDAVKFTNVNESFSIASNSGFFSLERRAPVTENDTLFYSFSRSTQRNYRFNVFMQHFETTGNLAAYLEDTYLHTSTAVELNGDTWVDFSVTGDAASSAKNRFRIVFKKLIQYTRINAAVADEDVAVNWHLSNELDINQYEIERSTNGTSFEKVGYQISAGNSPDGKTYSWLDIKPMPGVYYYRIKAIGNHGMEVFSDVAKVTVIKSSPAMFVFPNPVTNSTIGLQMNKMPAGVYETILMTEDGRVVDRTKIVHGGGSSTASIRPKSTLVSGSYRLDVIGPDKKKTSVMVIAQTR